MLSVNSYTIYLFCITNCITLRRRTSEISELVPNSFDLFNSSKHNNIWKWQEWFLDLLIISEYGNVLVTCNWGMICEQGYSVFFTCVAEGESRSRSAVTPSVRPSVPKSCHRNSSETTDPFIMKLGIICSYAYWQEILIPSFLLELCPLELRKYL